MSGQLDSPHFFRSGDTVRSVDGRLGTVIDAFTLFALISWDGGATEEIGQFEPLVVVIQRAEPLA